MCLIRVNTVVDLLSILELGNSGAGSWTCVIESLASVHGCRCGSLIWSSCEPERRMAVAGHVKRSADDHCTNCSAGSAVCAKAVLSELHIVPRPTAAEQKASLTRWSSNKHRFLLRVEDCFHNGMKKLRTFFFLVYISQIIIFLFLLQSVANVYLTSLTFWVYKYLSLYLAILILVFRIKKFKL